MIRFVVIMLAFWGGMGHASNLQTPEIEPFDIHVDYALGCTLSDETFVGTGYGQFGRSREMVLTESYDTADVLKQQYVLVDKRRGKVVAATVPGTYRGIDTLSEAVDRAIEQYPRLTLRRFAKEMKKQGFETTVAEAPLEVLECLKG
ncbi:hypothetical protein [uncultured Tateyamaria sp.]|uniref:hypothetical protein n=1 Tax=uncultured Tateyamaria sp. TaxID=455651 RepID=UPI00262512B5|nr:hypothetical protein [uncultured Tateyamaria sp.]